MIMFSVNQTGEGGNSGLGPSIRVKEQDCQSVLKLYDRCIRVQRLQIQLFLVRGVTSAELLCELICVQ